jgi:HAD superfamily hydrolase (TIGR01509 family)
MNTAFIFDMDGVLVDSNPFHKIALKEFCKRHGHHLTDQELREKIYGRTNKDWIPNIFGAVSAETLRTYANEKEILYRELYANDIVPVDGLIPFLEKLYKKGFPMAIGTSAQRANVDFTLAKTALGKYFRTILDEDFVTEGKPHPEVYIKAATALGIPNQRCIVIEDSLSGVTAGKSAGSKVIGITTTHTAEELHEADLIIENFVDLEPETIISALF